MGMINEELMKFVPQSVRDMNAECDRLAQEVEEHRKNLDGIQEIHRQIKQPKEK